MVPHSQREPPSPGAEPQGGVWRWVVILKSVYLELMPCGMSTGVCVPNDGTVLPSIPSPSEKVTEVYIQKCPEKQPSPRSHSWLLKSLNYSLAQWFSWLERHLLHQQVAG